MPIDWQQFHAGDHRTPAVVDPRRRLWIVFALFVVGLLIVAGRAVQLEANYGAAFRREALRPIEKKIVLPAARGRILARDGTVLAYDRTVEAVAIHYRWLQEPADDGWLRAQARSRLNRADRKNAEKAAAARAAVLADRDAAAARLAKLCGLSPSQWSAETRQIQTRVEGIAEKVNRHRPTTEDDADDSWAAQIRRLLLDDPPALRIVVAEELSYHVVADDVPKAVVAEIAEHAERYPGAKIVQLSRRSYPGKMLAAHVLGHLGAIDEDEFIAARNEAIDEDAPEYLPDDLVGRSGVEREYEARLRGRRGEAVESRDRSGRLLTTYPTREPVAGDDVRLTVDAELQRTAEELLHSAMERRTLLGGPMLAGGAIVGMDVRDGAIRAAASMPSFDPNAFARGDREEVAALLDDPAHPLFDRIGSMALPPGSTMKVVTAAALIESSTVDPQETFFCQGYLHDPDRQRCEIFVKQGVGHGDVTLADALSMSCNVYFFHFAGRMGPGPMVEWSKRFGFGRPTGVDLPSEAAGIVPSPENIATLEGHAWRTTDTQSMAVGQGSLTATPLQVLRMVAAVANGGRLLRPHVAEEGEQGSGVRDQGSEESERIPMSQQNLSAVREGLRRVVADPQGTAHGTVYIESIPIAGKTGTAETGIDRASHAWFAGYAPADRPTMAFVVVLEHAGEARVSAGPLVRRLVLRMDQLGML